LKGKDILKLTRIGHATAPFRISISLFLNVLSTISIKMLDRSVADTAAGAGWQQVLSTGH
jgi:hypothetical protein